MYYIYTVLNGGPSELVDEFEDFDDALNYLYQLQEDKPGQRFWMEREIEETGKEVFH